MAVTIDENILIFFMGAIFIPFIIFIIKLIIDFGIVKSKLDVICKDKEEQEKQLDRIDSFSNRVSILEIKVERVEKDLVVMIDKSPIKRVRFHDDKVTTNNDEEEQEDGEQRRRK